MRHYALDYPTLKKLNPLLIYASISGYGQFGDKANLGCYDIVAQAASGLMSLTGFPDMPLKTGPAIADAISGLTAAVGILGALYRREQTGEGAYIDIAMVDSVFAVLENALSNYTTDGVITERQGNSDAAIAPFDAFKVIDGWIALAVGNERLWKRLVSVAGVQLDRPQFATNEQRLQHYDELRPLLATWLHQHTIESALCVLHAEGIPSGPVHSIDELSRDVQLEARDMLLKIQIDETNSFTVPGSPIHISGADRALRPSRTQTR